MPDPSEPGPATATFAAGCAWGIEAAFRSLAGVVATVVGHAGGRTGRPTPTAVAAGSTGHVEAVEVTYDVDRIDLDALLEWFWAMHDPTIECRGSANFEHRYRSAVFCSSPAEVAVVRRSRNRVEIRLGRPVVTEIHGPTPFWPAPSEAQQLCEKRGIDLACWLPAESRARLGLPAAARSRSRPRPDLDPQCLADEFGASFGANLRDLTRALLEDERRVNAVLELVRAWRGRAGGVASSSDPFERVAVVSAPVATHAELQVAVERAELSVVVNLEPGNYLPSLHRDWSIVREVTQGSQMVDAGYPPHLRSKRAFDVGGGRQPRPDPALGVSGDWFDHVPAATLAIVREEGAIHHARWEGGDLRLLDHGNVDAEREEVLEVLGGKRCACLLLYEAWRPRWAPAACLRPARWAADEAWLSLLRPGPESDGTLALRDWSTVSRTVAERRAGRLDKAAPGQDWAAAHRWVQRLFSWLPELFQARWILTAMREYERETVTGAAGRSVIEAGLLHPLRTTILATLWQWCRQEPTIAYGAIDCRVVDRAEGPSVRGRLDGPTAHIEVGEPLIWLAKVWLRGLATVDGEFVVDVDEAPPGSEQLTARVARWHPTGRGEATIRVEPATLTWAQHRWTLA